jgi:hypothetical protein
MFNKVDNEFQIQIPCECNTEKIVISKFDDLEDYYYLSFWVDSFYSGQCLYWIWKERIKMAWKALRKGNFIFQEMTLDLKKIIELRDDLNTLINVESKDGKVSM